ncbi:SAV_2336 N-terminal domain-related protein [Streptomyces fructofermentans]|uniref:SAV_2336 N-terminal domain-related protein n=1 Tax=Streptomyces fructofermentans TaxID=152141 RepID=UPI003788E616
MLAGARGAGGEGPGPAPAELAELLWLAGHMKAPAEHGPAVPPAPPAPGAPPPADGPEPPPGPGSTPPGHGPAAPRDVRDPRGSQDAQDARDVHDSRAPRDRADPSGRPDRRVPLRLPGTRDPRGRGGPYSSLLAPAPPMLPHPLALQRSLRPLKRRVPAPRGRELDETATAHRIARLGAAPQWWLPVLRPLTERWLTLHLVHDTGPTMPVWAPLVRELHAALAQSGIFRTVETHRLETDGTVRRPGSQEAYADGRTVTLVVSDCVGPQWRDGRAGGRWYATLRRWAARMPVALVQPLPERLWRTTALPVTTARISAPSPAAPNSAYTVDAYAVDDPPPGTLPLPVLEPSAPWLANWSALVAGGSGLPGAIGLLDTAPPPAPVDAAGRGDVERLSPEELLLRFRSLASPEAFRLAGHLAVGPPELPVMRLVQAAIEKYPRPQHLAEVILSGALTAVPGRAGAYAFRPGVRELLLRTLPRTAHGRTSELLARVGASIDARAGMAAGDFRVAVPGAGGLSAEGEPFAAVREESVRRMGGSPPGPGLVLGRYRLVRRLGRGRQVVLAQDTRVDRLVAVYAYTGVDPERFLRDARALAEVGHPNVPTVHDFGVEGATAHLVTEFVEGLSVAELTAEGGFQLPFALLAPLARQVAQALDAVHARGLTHGGFTPNGLLVRPDGTVKVTHFALGAASARDATDDLAGFGHLLKELAEGEPGGELGGVPSRFRPLFGDAVTPLTSADPAARRRGQDLLLSPSYAQALEAVAADRYRYRLLGPVRISRGGDALRARPPREQALLAMLLLRQGRTVTHEELTLGLWGRTPPQRAARLLAGYAAGLRSALGPGVVATTSGGYALHAGPHCVDVDRCDGLVARARSHRDAGDPVSARAAVQDALDLWAGDPVDGVPGPAAETTRGRLRALRLTLCVLRAELDLENGDARRAGDDLGDLLRAHPGREDMRRLHLLALRAQGRVAEALDSYEAYEARQKGRRGEPDPVLRELGRTLRDLPRPAARRATAAPATAAAVLAGASHVLIGFDGPLVRLYTRATERQAVGELTALLTELTGPGAGPDPAPVPSGGTPFPPPEGRSNPLDLLRAFADRPQGADLRRRLNRIEERAVAGAAATPFSDALITTLGALGRRVAVVSDNAPSAVWKYLQAHGRLTGLVTGGVHGRTEDLTRLMPDPDCLLRALEGLGAAPSDAVLVGASVAELAAADAIGLRFLGYTRSERHRQRLVRAGCTLTTSSWAPLLRALPHT